MSSSTIMNASTQRESSPLSFVVRQPYPMPRLLEAINGVLYVNRIPGNATAAVERWAQIAVGQYYWAKATGTLKDNRPYSFYFARGVQVNTADLAKGLEITVPRSELVKFKHNTTLTIEFSVSFNGNNDESQALPFPSNVITLNRAPVSALLTFGAFPRGDKPVNSTLPFDYAKLTIKGYRAYIDLSKPVSQYFNPQFFGVNNGGSAWIDFDPPIGSASLSVTGTGTVQAFGTNNTLLFSRTGSWGQASLAIPAQAQEIVQMRIIDVPNQYSGFGIDNVRLYY